MSIRRIAIAAVCLAPPAAAQSAISVRDIGRLERVSTLPFQSVTTALPMPDGRVLVNDGRARRLIILDSTLSHETVIADTMGTAEEYARGSGEVLFRFRGDSALLVNITTQVALVLSPEGRVARVLAFPPPPGHPGGQVPIGGRGGIPGTDARGRLLYFYSTSRTGFGITTLRLGMRMDSVGLAGMPILDRIFRPERDSGPLLRVDLGTRKFDTAAMLKTPLWKQDFKTDADKGLVRIENVPSVFPVVDDYAITRDGAVAIVRGRDYHIDWIESDGHVTSTPKMPFAWQRLTDDQKKAAIDSAIRQGQAQYDRSSGGRGGRGGRANPNAPPVAPNLAIAPDLNDLPEYRPAFERGDVRADADGNIWIKTSTMIKDHPVYDIVNRKGELFDRVQLRAFRAIAGFAPSVVFMAVQDSASVVRLERARIK